MYGFGDSGCEAALIHAPIAVLPSPFPRDSFDKARRAMQLFNQVTDRITQNSDYLQQTLASAAAQDDFTVGTVLRHLTWDPRASACKVEGAL